jgi:hypothetical protein
MSKVEWNNLESVAAYGIWAGATAVVSVAAFYVGNSMI